jgi:hypothetical protein
MALDRYAAPIAIVESEAESGDQRKCPYCRWNSHTLYRLDSWPANHAGCAYCVLEFLRSDEYLIYHDRDHGAAPTAPPASDHATG